jgi:hypothetical protein
MSLNNLQDATSEVGVKGFTSAPGFTLPEDVNTIANRYWEVSTSGGSINASSASLYFLGSSVDASDKIVVVQADNAGGATADNIGGGVSGDFVTSFSEVTKPVLSIGIAEKVDIQIHDLITPHNLDNINDRLKIVNIEYTTNNTVTLIDRWGVVIKKWSNFRNYDDPLNPNDDGFDFSSMSPGNYICILEYQFTADAPKQKLTQMVTVLKGN